MLRTVGAGSSTKLLINIRRIVMVISRVGRASSNTAVNVAQATDELSSLVMNSGKYGNLIIVQAIKEKERQITADEEFQDDEIRDYRANKILERIEERRDSDLPDSIKEGLIKKDMGLLEKLYAS